MCERQLKEVFTVNSRGEDFSEMQHLGRMLLAAERHRPILPRPTALRVWHHHSRQYYLKPAGRALHARLASSSSKRPGQSTLSAMNEAVREAEQALTPRDHLMRLGLWALVSLNIGAAFSQGDEGAQLLLHLDEFTDAIVGAETSRSVLSDALERTARGAAANDTLKLRLLQTPRLVERLLEIVSSPSYGATARNHAVKVMALHAKTSGRGHGA